MLRSTTGNYCAYRNVLSSGYETHACTVARMSDEAQLCLPIQVAQRHSGPIVTPVLVQALDVVPLSELVLRVSMIS
jgi:hypothetical protein